MCLIGGTAFLDSVHFARQTMKIVPHPVYPLNLSPRDFWFFGYAKERKIK
jgi:hypothetical protein